MEEAKKFLNTALRDKVEKLLESSQAAPFFQETDIDIHKLYHEFQVHQIELEIQNEELWQAKESADKARDRFENLYEFAPTGYFTLSSKGEIVELNISGAQMLGKERSRLKNSIFVFFVSDDNKPRFNLFLNKIFENKTKQFCEITLVVEPDLRVEILLTGLIDKNEGQCLISAIDITTRKKMELKLKESEERFSLASKAAGFGTYSYYFQTGEGIYSEEYLNLFELSAEDTIELDCELVATAIHPDDRSRFLKEMLKANDPRGSGILDIEYRIVLKEGRLKWLRSRGLTRFTGNKVTDKPIHASGIVYEITRRKNAEDEIKESREQLAKLLKHLNEVREEERTSIAREIHDDLGQSLAGLKLDLLEIKEDINAKVRSKQKIDKAISLVNSTIKTVQKLSSQLRPQMLDELGLAAAIEWQADEVKKRMGIKCKLELDEIDGLEDNIPISVFRIFQAAVTNIMLHSKAKSISVNLTLKDEMLVLKIIDDGIGITLEQINSSKSFGIIGMRERANQINGRFEINSEKGKGTEILVSVPVMANMKSV